MTAVSGACDSHVMATRTARTARFRVTCPDCDAPVTVTMAPEQSRPLEPLAAYIDKVEGTCKHVPALNDGAREAELLAAVESESYLRYLENEGR